MAILEIIIGIALASLSLWSIQRYKVQTRRLLVAVWLFVAALIYVGFGLRTAESRWWVIEFGGLVVYGVLAVLGWKYSEWFLAIGWAGHVLWDVALHSNSEIWFVPKWYPGACLGFDLLVAVYAAFFLKQSSRG